MGTPLGLWKVLKKQGHLVPQNCALDTSVERKNFQNGVHFFLKKIESGSM